MIGRGKNLEDPATYQRGEHRLDLPNQGDPTATGGRTPASSVTRCAKDTPSGTRTPPMPAGRFSRPSATSYEIGAGLSMRARDTGCLRMAEPRQLSELHPALVSAARERLRFLVGEGGFVFDDEASAGTIALRSTRCTLLLVLVPASDPRYHNVDLWLGNEAVDLSLAVRQGLDRERLFDAGDLLLHDDPSLSTLELSQQVGRGRFPANTPSEVDSSVHRWAELLRTRLREFLHSEPSLWFALRREAIERVRRMGIESRLPSIKDAGRLAFDRGDYGEAIARYESIENHLTRGERKRLELARRRDGADAPV